MIQLNDLNPNLFSRRFLPGEGTYVIRQAGKQRTAAWGREIEEHSRRKTTTQDQPQYYMPQREPP